MSKGFYVRCPNCDTAVPESDIIEIKKSVEGFGKIFLGTVFENFVVKTDKVCKNCINKKGDD